MKTMVEDTNQPQLAGDLRADYAEVKGLPVSIADDPHASLV